MRIASVFGFTSARGSRILRRDGLVEACDLAHEIVEAAARGGAFAPRALKIAISSSFACPQKETPAKPATGVDRSSQDVRGGVRLCQPQRLPVVAVCSLRLSAKRRCQRSIGNDSLT